MPGFHLLNYTGSLGVNAADTELTGSTDPEFTGRTANNRYIFSEQYQILAALHNAASATEAELFIPKINAIGTHQIWPPNRSATIPSNPQLDDYRDYPIDLPLNEELRVRASNNLGAATEQTDVWLWIADKGWNRNLPRGEQRLTLEFTGAAAGTANVWGAAAAITFTDALKGGVYSVLGVEIFDAGTKAFRLIFPRMPLTNGRKFRPGTLCTEALGNVPMDTGPYFMGEWGRFHTFEQPQLEIFANATAASVQEGRMYVAYLGESMSLLRA